MKIEYNNEIINVLVEYKKRKTLEIKIDYDGTIRALVPKGIKEEFIIEIVKSKLPLIEDELKKRKKMSQSIEKKECSRSKESLYLGAKYPIKIIIDESNNKSIVSFENGMFLITVSSDEEGVINSAMENFYKKECNKIVKQRMSYYQKYFKTKPKVIKIVDSKNTWGTCNSNRNITFNWKLIMLPMEIIDYVVVHEMCHMAHLNHSKSFWRLVGKIIPDYKNRSEWLQKIIP